MSVENAWVAVFSGAMAVAGARMGDKMGDGDELGVFGGDRCRKCRGWCCNAGGTEGAK